MMRNCASDVCLPDVCMYVCLSVTYIGPKSRTERPRKTRIGTEVVTRKLLSSSTGQGSTCSLQGVGYIVAASHTTYYY